MRRSFTMVSVAPLLVAVMAIAGCGSDGDADAGSSPTIESSAAPAADAPTPVASTPSAAGGTSSVDSTVAVDETTESSVGAAGASSSGGELPTFTWASVDGAELYSVVVSDAAGVAFWGWQGSELTVTVGEGAPDPLVSADMTWSVVALDPDGVPLWESGSLPI